MKNFTYSSRGGAYIGRSRASWPFALLKVETEQITVSVFIFGTYKFTPGEITTIKPHRTMLKKKVGIEIEHVKNNYPERIIFLVVGGPDYILKQLKTKTYFGDAVQLD